ncbi:hypothetical protein Rhopal_004344-T1 [Rhodotorula paludigena]|uniref:Xylanolytic transcriptional activator regulatory domain-containing protein n=1 Tax=Rhodotorula paludigena TaxID=86838 RepID=A0AAV5GM88_9BASI|nr:hypothetical protein Rhopal_004344-T1 [Rhodotorula paludigena]
MPPRMQQRRPSSASVDITVGGPSGLSPPPSGAGASGGAAGAGSHTGGADGAAAGPSTDLASRPSEAGPIKEKKKLQRPSWSCIKRNKVHLCRLEQDDETGFVQPASLAPTAAPASSHGSARLATATEYEAIARNVNIVRQRLFHLERAVQAFVPQPDRLDPQGQPMWGIDLDLMQSTTPPSSSFSTPALGGPRPLPPTSLPSAAGSSAAPARDNEVEAAVTLEFLALGRDSKESHFSRQELRRPPSEEAEESAAPGTSPAMVDGSITDAPRVELASIASPARPLVPSSVLPDVLTSTRYIDYSLDKVLWQHGGVHAGQFRQECAEFYSWGEQREKKVNQAWLALYYALLCVAVKHMTEDDAQAYNLSANAQSALAKQFFDAAVDALHRSHFLLKHSIYAVQAINLFAVSCQDVGESDLIATLLAAGIRIAQHLRLHLFGPDTEWDAKRRRNGIDPNSPRGVKGLIEREIRKRVWYGLLTEDWISLHGRRAYAVSPAHFTTPLPLNCTDEDLSSGHIVNRAQDEPTPASKTILLYKVADHTRRFFEHIHSSKRLDYAYCLEADRALRSVILDGPSYLKADTGVEGHPPWAAWFRNYWVISISHKLLVVHRMFAAPASGAQDERQSHSRRVTIEAARSIIQQLARRPRASTQAYWTLPYHTMSAATTIMLDIFQSPEDPDVPHKRVEVQHALHELQQLAPGSHIAARGVSLLTTLLAEEARHRADAGGNLAAPSGAMPGALDGQRQFDGMAKRIAGSSGLPVISPSITSTTTPFFVPTTSTALPSTSLPDYASLAAQSVPSLSAAPLSQEALEALFQGLGGGSSFAHESIAGGDPSLSLLLSGNGTSGEPTLAGDGPTVDYWRMLNAGPLEGGFEFAGLGDDHAFPGGSAIDGLERSSDWAAWA